MMNYHGKVGFAIGTGRCGTLFLHQLVDRESHVASSHERNPDNETFHRYCKWHNLPVDNEGFLVAKEKEIGIDLESHAYSFEASPYLALSVRELHERFGAKFVLMIRRPDSVVTSFAHKGFYRHPYHVKNVNLATGYQDTGLERAYAFFARVAPTGEFLRDWNNLTQIGRVAWFWRAWNERTLDMLREIPEDSYRILRIEDFDYQKYLEVGKFLGFEAKIAKLEFDALKDSKPHAFWRKRNVDQWTTQEIMEFENEVGPLAQQFGYEYRVTELIGEAQAERLQAKEMGHLPEKKPQRMWRLRQTTARWLRDIAGGLDAK